MKVQEEKEEVKSKKFRRRKNQDMKVKEEREEIKKVSMAQGFTEKHPICPPSSATIRILNSGS